MSINDEIDHFLFKSKMTTMAPLEKLSAHLSTNSIAAIIVGVIVALIIIGVTTAYICNKYAEVSILFLSFHNNKSYFWFIFQQKGHGVHFTTPSCVFQTTPNNMTWVVETEV